ncbi:hypothetical protein J27TS7_09660 [Paenibacillus dendritiformis]|nr:hypothetical protein J27TS7_09660 [Paenibacillus dendritiformis]
MCSSSAAPRAIPIVMNKLDERPESRGRLFHILGSSANLVKVVNAMDIFPKCEYHQVQLGFVLERSGTRWLTGSGIAVGVIGAIIRNQAF